MSCMLLSLETGHNASRPIQVGEVFVKKRDGGSYIPLVKRVIVVKSEGANMYDHAMLTIETTREVYAFVSFKLSVDEDRLPAAFGVAGMKKRTKKPVQSYFEYKPDTALFSIKCVPFVEYTFSSPLLFCGQQVKKILFKPMAKGAAAGAARDTKKEQESATPSSSTGTALSPILKACKDAEHFQSRNRASTLDDDFKKYLESYVESVAKSGNETTKADVLGLLEGCISKLRGGDGNVLFGGLSGIQSLDFATGDESWFHSIVEHLDHT